MTFSIKYLDDLWTFETEYAVDEKTRQMFEDMAGIRNRITWTDRNIADFLSGGGRLVTASFTRAQNEKEPFKEWADRMFRGHFKKENLENVEKSVLCVYDPGCLTVEDVNGIITMFRGLLPEKTNLQFGWIADDQVQEFSIRILTVEPTKLLDDCLNEFVSLIPKGKILLEKRRPHNS
jgi:hypothetical protein